MIDALAPAKDEMVAHRTPLAGRTDECLACSEDFAAAYANRKKTLARMLQIMSPLARNVAPDAELRGRVKSALSIWYKMRAARLDRRRVLDAIGIRIILPEIRDCYRLLARIHREFRMVAEEFDDYIAKPKANGYRSLHTTVISPDGDAVEFQIRTRWMHELAEQGAASHHRYKQGKALIDML